jgi:hypothetical protein
MYNLCLTQAQRMIEKTVNKRWSTVLVTVLGRKCWERLVPRGHWHKYTNTGK